MVNALLNLIGWPALILQANPTVFDRWWWVRRHLQPGPLKTLDAGCGAGELTLYAARRGNRAVGLSFDQRLNRIGAVRAGLLRLPNASFVTADLKQVAALFRPAAFDQVLCLETIEHLLDDEAVIAGLAAVLRPGGRLLLTTPNEHARRPAGARLSAREDGGHVRWGYTHASLRRLFGAHGLQVAAAGYVSGLVSQRLARWMEVEPAPRRYLAWALTFPLRLAQAVDAPLSRRLRYPFLSVAVVGVKR